VLWAGVGCRSLEPPAQDANIGPSRGSYEFAVGGAGQANDRLNGAGVSLSAAAGYYLQNDWLLSLRQDVGYSDVGNDTSTGFTRLALDWVRPEGWFRPLIGASLGFAYGESINETIAIGPEVGLRYFVKPSTFVEAKVEWQVFFTTTEDSSEIFDDGALLYSIGLGVTF